MKLMLEIGNEKKPLKISVASKSIPLLFKNETYPNCLIC